MLQKRKKTDKFYIRKKMISAEVIEKGHQPSQKGHAGNMHVHMCRCGKINCNL
jgi:hypothetical protein